MKTLHPFSLNRLWSYISGCRQYLFWKNQSIAFTFAAKLVSGLNPELKWESG